MFTTLHLHLSLDGDEAKYAAYGVISGFSDADGVVGDLGGGSLEVIEVADHTAIFDLLVNAIAHSSLCRYRPTAETPRR